MLSYTKYKNININNLNSSDLKKLQEFLIQQGFLDSTYKNKAGVTRSANDGILGSRTKAAYEKYNSQPEPKFQETNSTINYPNLSFQLGLVMGGAPTIENDYMSQTRSEKATAKEIAEERLKTVGDYITKDFGKDLNYNVLQNIVKHYGIMEQNDKFERNLDKIKAQYKKETGKDLNLSDRQVAQLASELLQIPLRYEETAASRHPKTLAEIPNFIEESQYDLDGRKRGDENTVSNNQIRQLVTKKSTSKVEHRSFKGSDTPNADYLSDKDREVWKQNKLPEIIINAELLSQINDYKTQLDNSITPEVKSDLKTKINNIATRIALTNNAKKFRYDNESSSHKTMDNPDLQEYFQNISDAEKYLNENKVSEVPENYLQNIQKGYDTFGVSPQYEFFNWREKQLLDKLYGAGYSYYDVDYLKEHPDILNGRSIQEIYLQKINDALSGRFTGTSYNGSDNSRFTRNAFREGVNNHTNQLGERLNSYKYNKAPLNLTFGRTNKPLFQISKYAAFDPDLKEGTQYKIALSENPYFNHTRIGNIFDNAALAVMNGQDFRDQDSINKFFDNLSFNVKDTFGNPEYKTSSSLPLKIRNAAQRTANIIDPSNSNYLNGNNSIYRIGVKGKNKYDNANAYSNHAIGMQYHNGTPYNYTQDKFDYNIGWISLFNAPYYRTDVPISKEQFTKIQQNANKVKGEE